MSLTCAVEIDAECSSNLEVRLRHSELSKGVASICAVVRVLVFERCFGFHFAVWAERLHVHVVDLPRSAHEHQRHIRVGVGQRLGVPPVVDVAEVDHTELEWDIAVEADRTRAREDHAVSIRNSHVVQCSVVRKITIKR